ncbi:hypothetical protein UlMin_008328 [Ulmus minor]
MKGRYSVPDKLLDQTSVTHLFPITEYLGLLATCMRADALSKWISDKSQVYTQRAYMRPLGVVAMVLGIDDQFGSRLYKCDPAGHFFGHKATSAGLKEQEATNEETVQTAISALQSVLQEDFKANQIEVGVVRTDNMVFIVLSTLEIDEHLTVISERD